MKKKDRGAESKARSSGRTANNQAQPREVRVNSSTPAKRAHGTLYIRDIVVLDSEAPGRGSCANGEKAGGAAAGRELRRDQIASTKWLLSCIRG
jgi:hypothetical protein